jgi:toxin-antitoxin system PIN domain toxin
MRLPDVNVLVYAYRTDAGKHAAARDWIEKAADGASRFAMSKLTLAAFVRIVTERRIYPVPTALDNAFDFCNSILAQPNCKIIEPGERHWLIFQGLCIETNTRGGDTTDAWYAALAIEWGCEFVTFDRDFLKYPGLNCTILS